MAGFGFDLIFLWHLLQQMHRILTSSDQFANKKEKEVGAQGSATLNCIVMSFTKRNGCLTCDVTKLFF